MSKGLIYIFTGDGKGKTSAALGVGVRAALTGMKVAMVCWYKERSWDVSEFRVSQILKNMRIYPMGKGFYIQSKGQRAKGKGKEINAAPLTGGDMAVDRASEEEHREAARAALQKARDLTGKVDVLILDEVNNAIHDGLIKASEVVSFVKKRGRTHVILTGRDAHKEMIEVADLVTEMRKVKHPYDRGIKAVKGLDY